MTQAAIHTATSGQHSDTMHQSICRKMLYIGKALEMLAAAQSKYAVCRTIVAQAATACMTGLQPYHASSVERVGDSFNICCMNSLEDLRTQSDRSTKLNVRLAATIKYCAQAGCGRLVTCIPIQSSLVLQYAFSHLSGYHPQLA